MEAELEWRLQRIEADLTEIKTAVLNLTAKLEAQIAPRSAEEFLTRLGQKIPKDPAT